MMAAKGGYRKFPRADLPYPRYDMTTAYWDAEIRRAHGTIGSGTEEFAEYLRDEFPHDSFNWVVRESGRLAPRAPRRRTRRTGWIGRFWARVASVAWGR
jgi:hypothetical protein